MNIVPMIAGGKIVKSHTQYAITNSEWVLVRLSLIQYMNMVGVDSFYNDAIKFNYYAGVTEFYVRRCYSMYYKSCKYDNSVKEQRYLFDPWNRRFMVSPYNLGTVRDDKDNRYVVDGYYSSVVGGGDMFEGNNVYVITTTVNGEVVYCVDVMEWYDK